MLLLTKKSTKKIRKKYLGIFIYIGILHRAQANQELKLDIKE